MRPIHYAAPALAVLSFGLASAQTPADSPAGAHAEMFVDSVPDHVIERPERDPNPRPPREVDGELIDPGRPLDLPAPPPPPYSRAPSPNIGDVRILGPTLASNYPEVISALVYQGAPYVIVRYNHHLAYGKPSQLALFDLAAGTATVLGAASGRNDQEMILVGSYVYFLTGLTLQRLNLDDVSIGVEILGALFERPGDSIGQMAAGDDGKVYVATMSRGVLWRYDPSSGALDRLGLIAPREWFVGAVQPKLQLNKIVVSGSNEARAYFAEKPVGYSFSSKSKVPYRIVGSTVPNMDGDYSAVAQGADADGPYFKLTSRAGGGTLPNVPLTLATPGMKLINTLNFQENVLIAGLEVGEVAPGDFRAFIGLRYPEENRYHGAVVGLTSPGTTMCHYDVVPFRARYSINREIPFNDPSGYTTTIAIGTSPVSSGALCGGAPDPSFNLPFYGFGRSASGTVYQLGAPKALEEWTRDTGISFDFSRLEPHSGSGGTSTLTSSMGGQSWSIDATNITLHPNVAQLYTPLQVDRPSGPPDSALISAGAYAPYSTLNLRDGSVSYLGNPSGVSPYDMIAPSFDEVYINGYAATTMRYDPTSSWTISPSNDDIPCGDPGAPNPCKIPGFAKYHRASVLVHDTLFVAGDYERDLKIGGQIGWLDPESPNQFVTYWSKVKTPEMAPNNCYAPSALYPVEGGATLVLFGSRETGSTKSSPDDTVGNDCTAPDAPSRIFKFDPILKEFTSKVPVANNMRVHLAVPIDDHAAWGIRRYLAAGPNGGKIVRHTVAHIDIDTGDLNASGDYLDNVANGNVFPVEMRYRAGATDTAGNLYLPLGSAKVTTAPDGSKSITYACKIVKYSRSGPNVTSDVLVQDLGMRCTGLVRIGPEVCVLGAPAHVCVRVE